MVIYIFVRFQDIFKYNKYLHFEWISQTINIITSKLIINQYSVV